MTDNKKYKVLDSLPAYGDMYVPFSESDKSYYSEGYVVQFYRRDGSNWVGNFEPGLSSFYDVIELLHSPNVIVISGGKCYVINPDVEKVLDIFGGFFESFIHGPDERLILADSFSLTIVESNGNYWCSERISWDGIADLTITNNVVSGVAYAPTAGSDEWEPFSYNIDTQILNGGRY